ncbi:MAG: hypothetical protein ACJ77M_09080 [Thermoleophilaceae bacterium]
MSARVWALLVDGADPAVCRGQTRPPERAVSVAELRGGAFDAPPDWLWVLNRRVRPSDSCLAELLAAASSLDGLPAPVLLASHVASSDPLAEPVPSLDKELEIEAASRRLVPVRALPTTSFLMHPGVASPALEHGHVFAFTAHLLRDSPGYLVPGSRATLEGPVPERLAARARTLRSSWRGAEAVWFALRLLSQARPGSS